MAPGEHQHGSAPGIAWDTGIDKEGREDWEDWDDEPTTPTTPEQPLVGRASDAPSRAERRSRRQSQPRVSNAGLSAQRISRLKSRKRQKAQNAKAGIRLITDMSSFRKGQQHVAQQLKATVGTPDERTGKFVDAAALRALEGEPDSASVGNWAWLRRKTTSKSHKKKPSQRSLASTGEQGLSPGDRPIMIGIALPSDDVAYRATSPQTATVESAVATQHHLPAGYAPAPPSNGSPQQFRSVWSPDTEDGLSPGASSTATASVYSSYANAPSQRNVPPVPSVPSNYKPRPRLSSEAEDDDDDTFTPVTLFEEDGSPLTTRKSPKSAAPTISPETARTRSGWWDHVRTPFTERWSPFSAKARSEKEEASPAVREEWWNKSDEKRSHPPHGERNLTAPPPMPTRLPANIPIIRVPTPTIASSSRTTPTLAEGQPESHADKARALAEESRSAADDPPPYSPPSKQAQVRYRAVFPPGHPLTLQFPPSPGPATPGLAGTMTSQGGIAMTEVPLTPRQAAPALPDRQPGTYITGEHFARLTGKSPAAKAERRRRRHEKEDYAARKVGSLWRGRACVPRSGCLGRTGREGRKRRRVCLAVCGGLVALVVLAAVLAATLTKKAVHHAPVDTVWLNLTDFPPIPTGLSTVAGPDNTVSVSGCTRPATLWTCSLPKEQHDSVAPSRPNQPRFFFQIQLDNSTRQLWNVSGQEPPRPSKAQAVAPAGAAGEDEQGSSGRIFFSGHGGAARARAVLRDAGSFDAGFAPSPAPPSFREMWFLGNTSDGVVSDAKAGEPTPFYISFFPSNRTAGPDVLGRRGAGNGADAGGAGAGGNGTLSGNLTDLLPPPRLNPDGTGAPAALLAYPSQQPLRLFDRGLPTEHYGFYSYYDKTTYVKSVAALGDAAAAGQGDVPADQDGGSLETEANFLVTWTQTRFVVKIWTRTQNSTRLLGGGGGAQNATSSAPGSFPYPVTVRLDTHGGDFDRKASFYYGVDDRQRVVRAETQLVPNFVGFDAPRVNPGASADPGLGGIDGGTGGCRCEWQNFVATRG